MEKFVLNNVKKRFSGQTDLDNFVLKGINLEWNEGEIISIMGDSGSGKTTIARLMVGLEKSSEGEILFNDENIAKWHPKQWKDKRKHIQAVFQDASGTLNRSLSVYKNMEEPLLNLTNKNKRERLDILYDLMNKTKMDTKLLTTKTKNLSGGEQRRLALLRALAIKPKFLILDEVTSGLDFKTKDIIGKLLRTYHQDYKVSYLIITHDEKFAKSIAHKIIKIENGRFVRVGKRDIGNSE